MFQSWYLLLCQKHLYTKCVVSRIWSSHGATTQKTAIFQCVVRLTVLLENLLFFNLLLIRSCGLFQFRITSEIMNHQHMVGLLGRVISSSQGLYLHRTTRDRETRTNIHTLSGIRSRDPVYERSRPAPQTARATGSEENLLVRKNLVFLSECSAVT
jgi:hypothetical protein